MKALLVYPEFREKTYWSFKECMDIIDKKANMPPYGLITIAGMLPKDWELSLVDENVSTLSDEQVKSADIIMASAMIAQRDALQELIYRCNRLGKPIVVGGPLISTGFETIKGADHYFIGEAEKTLATFAADIQEGSAKKAYAHVVETAKGERIKKFFKGDAHIVTGPRAALSDTAIPRFNLLDIKKYVSMAVQFSRGCPNQCEFCDIWTQSGIVPRLKSVERLLAELQAIHDTGYRGSVFVVDDNFIGNRGVVKRELLPTLSKWQQEHRYPFSFYTEATVLMADDDELLHKMRDAGFTMVFCGIETPNEASLLEVGKRINTNKDSTVDGLLARVRRIQAAGMEVSSGFIIGFDNDPQNIDDMMIDFIQRSNIPMAMLGLLTALPETKLYERLEREGRLKTASVGNNTHAFDLNFATKMPEEQVLVKYSRILNTIYDPSMKNYFDRVDRMMDATHWLEVVNRDVQSGEVKAFLKSFKAIVPTRYGWNYLKFLATRLVKNYRTFPEAVAYGVKGHHLARITRSAVQTHKVVSYLDQQLASLKTYVDGLLESSHARVQAVQGGYNARVQGMQASYQRGVQNAQDSFALHKVNLKKAYAQKQAALRGARRQLRKLNDESRQHVMDRYQKFVEDVQRLYQPLDSMRVA